MYIHNQYIFSIYLFICIKIIAHAHNLFLSLNIEHISENNKVRVNVLCKMSIKNKY